MFVFSWQEGTVANYKRVLSILFPFYTAQNLVLTLPL